MQTLTISARLRALLGGQSTLRQHLARAAAGSAILALSSKLLMLLTSVFLARWMGAEGYGIYATAMALVLLLSVPSGLGLPMLMIRYLASYGVHQQWPLMRGLLIRANQAVLAISLLTVGVAGIAIWVLADQMGDDQAATLGLALGIIPLVALGAIRSAALRGLHHIIRGQLPESLIMPGLFLALITGLWLWSGDNSALSPTSVIGLRLLATATAFIVGAWLLLHQLPIEIRKVTPKYDIASWRRAAGPLLFLGGMNIINTQTDVLMLAAIQGPESAGIYQASARGAELVALSLVVVNMAIQPTISRLYSAREIHKLQRVITTAARAALTLALPLALTLSWFAEPILGSIFGDDFERGAMSLAILCAAQIVNAAAGSVGVILNMTGHERDTAAGVAISAAANVSLNAILVPLFDLTGAAIATGISLVIWNVILVRKVRQRTGINSTVLVKQK